jgi:hypothetical protein
MPSPKCYVFEWLDDAVKVAFVNWSAEREPWLKLWEERADYLSGLNDWLRTLDKPPRLVVINQRPIYAGAARSLVRLRQAALRGDGYNVLLDRDKDTIKAGKQPRRPVYVTDGFGKQCWFSSVSAAARALGLSKSAVTQAAQDPNRTDVRYDAPGANNHASAS